MCRKICYLLLLLGLGLTAGSCSSYAHFGAKALGWSNVTFYDPVCAQVAMEILDAIHAPRNAYVLPLAVWKRWRCVRNINSLGRVTLVLPKESASYRLMLVFAENKRVSKASIDPEGLQGAIGTMAMNAQFDFLTKEGANQLAKNGSVTFSFDIKPGE